MIVTIRNDVIFELTVFRYAVFITIILQQISDYIKKNRINKSKNVEKIVFSVLKQNKSKYTKIYQGFKN